MSVNSSTRSGGFTLIELVVIIMVLGIMAVVVLPRLNPTDYRAVEFHDQTVAALRYAQKTATSHRRLVCVSFPNNASLRLTIASANPAVACDTNLLLPASNSNTLTSPDASNVFFNTVAPPPIPAAFNFQPNGTSIDQTLFINGQANILVIGATGYVQ